MTFTKMDLVEILAGKTDLLKKDAKKVVELVFEEMKSTLSKGEEVKISSFGNFKVLKKNARIGRNPKTGEEAIISARKVVSFHSGQKLKESVADIE